MRLFQKLINQLNKYKSKQIKYHCNGKQIDLTSDNVTIASNNFNVDSSGNVTCTNANISGTVNATSGSFTGEVNATSGSFTGSITATSGNFQNCNIQSNCSVAGGSIMTSSSGRIPNLYVSSLDAMAIGADAIGLNNEYEVFSVGNYTGESETIRVLTALTLDSEGKVTAQTWKNLVFKGGILVGIQNTQ